MVYQILKKWHRNCEQAGCDKCKYAVDCKKLWNILQKFRLIIQEMIKESE